MTLAGFEDAPMILPLDSAQASMELAGGKGANLARLSRAGLPVPGGFLITTRAYRAFVADNNLAGRIEAALAQAQADDPESLERASIRIRALFAAGSLPPVLSREMLAAYESLGRPPVAVRSSATAEDLPEMSFAGQQDTYLNVTGEAGLLEAVVSCWSSLWTARAIGYRARNGVDHSGVALAVVVQEMIRSQVSGVLFTANPLTGQRGETVIDAIFGLGEALVSGQVEPDHYVVGRGGRILSKTIGAKAVSIRGWDGGGTLTMSEPDAQRQALEDGQILALADLAQQVAALYGSPQDIEWAWADGRFTLLQSRPITSLFPIPEGTGPEELKVWFSFAAVQGILDPITPLGQDVLRTFFATGAGLFGVRVTAETQAVLYSAGERLWVNITPIVRSPIGRRAVDLALGMVEPGARQAVLSILDDPRLQPAHAGVRPRTALRLAGFILPVAGNALLNLASPHKRRKQIVEEGEGILEWMRARAAAIQGDRYARLAGQAGLLQVLVEEGLPRLMLRFVSLVAAGMASFNLLNRLSRGMGSGRAGEGWADLVLEVSRGVPHNPTTEMDLALALWQAARQIQADPPSRQAFTQNSSSELAACFQAGKLPAPAQQAIGDFMARYGGRGLAEIDVGRPRWREEPDPVIEAIAGYLQIQDERQAPDAVFARSAHSAGQAVARLEQAARQQSGGWFKAPLVRFFAGRARALLGARESPKFFVVRLLDILRHSLLESGRELVRAGELERPDDLVFLSLKEIETLAAERGSRPGEWRQRIARRRRTYSRELLRKQIPRLLLSDGRAFYEGVRPPAGAGDAIHGSPVSPGSATGRVRVVLDPRQAQLQPGEILVCVGTDPSWTPLFLTAAGLVMEVGGMMTHGAVVAREYGIPAIVGVDQATRRLRTGQQVRIDGSSGEIHILDDIPASSG